MSNISGLLGTAGGFKGTGVDAPNDWVNGSKLDAAQTNLDTGMSGQNNLLAALQGQNGLGNQTSVYNQMQNVANGTGPNPAQAQLAQATGANTANQAALMAGQRGSSANTGLMARQAAMQGGANQQNSAGQAATLQAQQSLNALGQMGGMANTMATNQIGQTNANVSAAQAHQNALLNQNANQNAIRQSLITGTAQQQASGMGSGINAAGSSMSSSGSSGGSGGGGGEFGAEGGQVGQMPKMAMGGALGSLFSFAEGGPVDGSAYQGQSAFGQFLNTPDVQTVSPGAQQTWGTDQLANSGKNFGSKKHSKADGDSGVPMDASDNYAEGGKVPAMVSPGEQYLPPKDVKKVIEDKKDPLETGERIPGKPKHKGNNYANDTVSKTLEEGGIVIPNSVMQSKNPHWEAMKFVHAHAMKNRKALPKRPKGK